MSVPRLATLAAGTCGALLACAALAQPVYRIVGPDGKVSFSDRAPEDGKSKAAPVAAAAAAAGSATASLPAALREPSTRFPVTLYTGNDCAPCNSARNLLVNRGIPFTERTVNSNNDLDALKRLSGDTSLPFGSIGKQQLRGFSDTEWTQYLDLAGYPQQSQLPASYRRPAATPLVAEQPAAAPAPAEAAASAPASRRRAITPPPPPAPGTPTPSNPAGIRF